MDAQLESRNDWPYVASDYGWADISTYPISCCGSEEVKGSKAASYGAVAVRLRLRLRLLAVAVAVAVQLRLRLRLTTL